MVAPAGGPAMLPPPPAPPAAPPPAPGPMGVFVPVNFVPPQPIEIAMQPTVIGPAARAPVAAQAAPLPAPAVVNTVNGNGRGLLMAIFGVALATLVAALVGAGMVWSVAQKDVSTADQVGVLTGEMMKVAVASNNTANNVGTLITSVDNLTTATDGLRKSVDTVTQNQVVLHKEVQNAIEDNRKRDEAIAAKLRKIGKSTTELADRVKSQGATGALSPLTSPSASAVRPEVNSWVRVTRERSKDGE